MLSTDPSPVMIVQARNPTSRSIIQSGSVNTPDGRINLDSHPDVAEIILLSDELGLDELTSLALVLAAQEQSGMVSAAAAAGIYYEERLASVQSLTLLFHSQVVGSDVLEPDVYATIAACNAALLAEEREGKTIFVHRLVDLIRSGTLPTNGTPLSQCIDSCGRAVGHAQLKQRECLVSKTLAYWVWCFLCARPSHFACILGCFAGTVPRAFVCVLHQTAGYPIRYCLLAGPAASPRTTG